MNHRMSEHLPIVPWGVRIKDRPISQLVIKCRSEADALAKIASKMAEHNIDIVSGTIITEPDIGIGVITMFLDFTSSNINIDHIVDELKALDVVLDVKIAAREFSGIIADMGTYVATYLCRMLNWLDKVFGTGGHAILFDMGEEAVKPIVKELKSRGFKGRQLVESFLATNSIMGFYSYEIVEYDEENLKFVIRLYRNFECKSFTGKKDHPMSHLVRGALTAVFSETYGRRFEVKEVKCIAKGDEYCEFVIMPEERLK